MGSSRLFADRTQAIVLLVSYGVYCVGALLSHHSLIASLMAPSGRPGGMEPQTPTVAAASDRTISLGYQCHRHCCCEMRFFCFFAQVYVHRSHKHIAGRGGVQGFAVQDAKNMEVKPHLSQSLKGVNACLM